MFDDFWLFLLIVEWCDCFICKSKFILKFRNNFVFWVDFFIRRNMLFFLRIFLLSWLRILWRLYWLQNLQHLFALHFVLFICNISQSLDFFFLCYDHVWVSRYGCLFSTFIFFETIVYHVGQFSNSFFQTCIFCLKYTKSIIFWFFNHFFHWNEANLFFFL